MSEEVLKALMQFFAIINKQSIDSKVSFDIKYVEDFIRSHVSAFYLQEYLQIYKEETKEKKKLDKHGNLVERTSVVDSVKVLGLCKRISVTLNKEKKIVVLIRLLEFIKLVGLVNENTLDIIKLASIVFQIDENDFEASKQMILEGNVENLNSDRICVIADQNVILQNPKVKSIEKNNFDGHVRIGSFGSVDTMFLYYIGGDNLSLNGLPITPMHIYVFSRGSILKFPKSGQLYYTDIFDVFSGKDELSKITFSATDINYFFTNKTQGLHEVNLQLKGGNLVAIMGTSGAGKSTLLMTLTGLYKPSSGKVRINGFDVHDQVDLLKGVIGYIPQDDLLIGDLTVYENLYFNAKLCFNNLNEQELKSKVDKTLQELGLYETRDIKVGTPLVKKISGGQRKRLNLALELIREPSVLFVDEPTSGLSSRDSEIIINLLKEQSQRGRIIFVVIHQPSSDIFKTFDQLLILDKGGYPIFYGNAVESVIYFKTKTHQVNNEVGECQLCGNVNPELVFDLIEAKIVGDDGVYLDKRRIDPLQWNEIYKEDRALETKAFTESKEKIRGNLNRPNWFGQILVYLKRDFTSKKSNLNYILVNLFEASFLAFLISLLIRYTDPEIAIYRFSENKNIPAFLFIAVVVALFMGLTLSAEEILKDRKILKRENFLSLSWTAYLTAKITLLFAITVFQTFSFILVGKLMLGFNDLYTEHWVILFSLGCSAVLIGLLISSLFTRAVTVYILIPVLLIPQMVLSGAIFNFDELHHWFGNEEKVPLIADGMVARWGYEALLVSSFVENKYMKNYYEINQKLNEEHYLQLIYLPKIKDLALKLIDEQRDEKGKEYEATLNDKRELFEEEIELNYLEVLSHALGDNYLKDRGVELSNFSEPQLNYLIFRIDKMIEEVKDKLLILEQRKETVTDSLLNALGSASEFRELLYSHHNKYVENVVRNIYQTKDIVIKNGKIVRKKNWIYDKAHNSSYLDYRTHLFSPNKELFGMEFSTHNFNTIVIWLLNCIIIIGLFTNFLPRIVTRLTK